MSDKKITNVYDDGNIPEADLPQRNSGNTAKDSTHAGDIAEPLPETTRPRKDGPGGD